MANLYELEAMILSRDQMLARVLEVFIAPQCGEAYREAIAKADQLIREASEEVRLLGG